MNNMYHSSNIFHLLGIHNRIVDHSILSENTDEYNNNQLSHNVRGQKKRTECTSFKMCNIEDTSFVDNNVLTFAREEVDSTFTGIDFRVQKKWYIGKNHLFLEGLASFSRNISSGCTKRKMSIDYDIVNDMFYESTICKNGKVRHIHILEIDDAEELGVHNKDYLKQLLWNT